MNNFQNMIFQQNQLQQMENFQQEQFRRQQQNGATLQWDNEPSQSAEFLEAQASIDAFDINALSEEFNSRKKANESWFEEEKKKMNEKFFSGFSALDNINSIEDVKSYFG